MDNRVDVAFHRTAKKLEQKPERERNNNARIARGSRRNHGHINRILFSRAHLQAAQLHMPKVSEQVG
jgi:hypothetical protein